MENRGYLIFSAHKLKANLLGSTEQGNFIRRWPMEAITIFFSQTLMASCNHVENELDLSLMGRCIFLASLNLAIAAMTAEFIVNSSWIKIHFFRFLALFITICEPWVVKLIRNLSQFNIISIDLFANHNILKLHPIAGESSGFIGKNVVNLS